VCAPGWQTPCGATENPLAPNNIKQHELTLIGGKYGEGRWHLMLPGGLCRVSRSRGRRIEGRRHIHVARHGIGGGGGQLLAPVQLLQLGGQGARAAEAHGRRQEVAHEGGGGGGRALLLARTVQHRVVVLNLLLLLLLLMLVVVELVRAAVAKAQGWVVAVLLKRRMIMI